VGTMNDSPAPEEPIAAAPTCTEGPSATTLSDEFDPASSASNSVSPSPAVTEPTMYLPTVYLPTSDSGWFSSGWTNDGTDGSDVPPTVTEEQPLLPGDVATYRCEDCRDRWDLIVPGGEDEDGEYNRYGDRNDGYPEGW
jgi:hypothetical protein